jgi:hypothetical protein
MEMESRGGWIHQAGLGQRRAIVRQMWLAVQQGNRAAKAAAPKLVGGTDTCH